MATGTGNGSFQKPIYDDLGCVIADINKYNQQQQQQLDFINKAWEDVDVNSIPCYPPQENS